jgi:BASS family bile acid:Na+ symporter
MTLVFLSVDLDAAVANLKKFHNIALVFVITKAVFPFLLFHLFRPFGTEIATAVLLLSLTPFAAISPTLTKVLNGDTEFILLVQIIMTLTAPLYMPFLILLIAGAEVELNVLQMMKTLVFLILIPFGISLIIRLLFPGTVKKTKKYFSAVTILLIALLITGLIAGASGPITAEPFKALPIAGFSVILAVILILSGWFGFFFLDKKKRIGLSVSNLYMNIGLSAVVASGFFSDTVLLFVLIYELPANLLPQLLGRLKFMRPDDDGEG